MTVHFQPGLDFEAVARATADGQALVLDLDGFEGPLDLLLELARRQKVDLLAISITALAEQYLSFIQAARKTHFALAADYLVMAAWLAFLKSRLLLPRAERPADEPAPEEAAEALAFRLARLAAMREAGDALMARERLHRDVFPRGDPDALTVQGSTRIEGDLHALLTAYLDRRLRADRPTYAPARRVQAYPLEAARERLKRLLPSLADWRLLEAVAPAVSTDGPGRASCVASTLAAALEMARDGALELSQVQAFAPLHLRARPAV